MSPQDNQGSSREQPPAQHYDRDQVITAFKQFVENGTTHPDDLDRTNPEVIKAYVILDSWNADILQEAERAGDEAARLEYNLNRSTILRDAGFSDPAFLDEVANDWLEDNDLPNAEATGLTELAAKIRTKIDEINARIANPETFGTITPSQEISEVLTGFGEELGFDEETCAEIAAQPFEEAFQTAYGYLSQAGLNADEILARFLEQQ